MTFGCLAWLQHRSRASGWLAFNRDLSIVPSHCPLSDCSSPSVSSSPSSVTVFTAPFTILPVTRLRHRLPPLIRRARCCFLSNTSWKARVESPNQHHTRSQLDTPLPSLPRQPWPTIINMSDSEDDKPLVGTSIVIGASHLPPSRVLGFWLSRIPARG